MLAGHWQELVVKDLSASDAQPHLLGLQALARNAMQTAGFNAPELILPILKHVGGAALTTIVQQSNILMALPLVDHKIYRASWQTPLMASGLPHVAAGISETVLHAFMNAQTKPVLFKSIPTDGTFLATLRKQSAHFEILESWQRAALKPSGGYDDWLQTNFDKKRRKELKRQRNRLAEQGALTSVELKMGEEVMPFVSSLLRLEASGWKGKKGTALNDNPNLVAAFHAAAGALHAAGKLRFWSLKLNGIAIASLFAIVEGSQAWLGKIAYDEAYAKFSPGVLLIMDCTKSFFAESQVKLIDSSAIPNHPMIDHIWRDRLDMVDVLVAPATISILRFKTILSLEKMRRTLRSLARDTYYKINGAHRT